MKRSKYIFITAIVFTIVSGSLVLAVAGRSPPSTVLKADPPSSPPTTQEEQVEEALVDTVALAASSTELVASQVTPEPDGPTLLKEHCTQCHVIQWFAQVKKTHNGWEKSLVQMEEEMGVHLSDAEKVVLLEYLTVANDP